MINHPREAAEGIVTDYARMLCLADVRIRQAWRERSTNGTTFMLEMNEPIPNWMPSLTETFRPGIHRDPPPPRPEPRSRYELLAGGWLDLLEDVSDGHEDPTELVLTDVRGAPSPVGVVEGVLDESL